MNMKNYQQDELPDHPQAAAIDTQLRQLGILLDSWIWSVYDDGDLTVTMYLQGDHTSLRLWVGQERINIDVRVITVPFEVQMLTWILMENIGQEFKARAVQSSEEQVQVFVTANYPLSRLGELESLIWKGFDAALGWRGRIWQVEIPAEPEGLSA